MNLKQRFAEKSFGFYVTLAAVVLAIITAIVYAVGYSNTPRFLSWPAFILLIAGAVVTLALAFFNLDEFGTGVMALCSLIALLLFAQIIYNYVVVVMVGIDLANFDPEFLASTILFALTFVVSVVCVFLPQNKPKKEVE